MNGRGDIDGILEGWFLDGPTQMPDRLFDAVLDQVERVPQRRLARLQLRFSDMSTSSRLLAAGAAAVLVIGVGVVALGRANEQGPGTPSPSSSASPTSSTDPGSPVPAALYHTMLGAPRDTASVGLSSIIFTNDRFAYNESSLRSEASGVGGDEIRLISDSIAGGCQDGDEGRYSWAPTPGGTKFTFTLVSDECDARAAVLPGEWQRLACENTDNDCLGRLEAEHYSSHFVDPFVQDPNAWAPRFGALQYDVPDGWENTADYPEFYDLKRSEDPDGAGVFIVTDVVAISATEPCLDEPDPAVGRSVDELVAWLMQLDGVVASTPEPVTIGGLNGYRVDVSMDPAWTMTCPFSQGEPARPLFTDGSGGDFHWGLGPEIRERNYLLDSGNGWTMLIDIEAQGDAFDAFVDEADAVVNSMVFTAP